MVIGEKPSNLVIYAPGVRSGGGAVLLNELISAGSNELNVKVVVDARFSISVNRQRSISIVKIPKGLLGRIFMEFSLSRQLGSKDRLLCFSNIPPLFPVRAKVSVFVQNRFLVDCERWPLGMELRVKLRLWVERVWLQCCLAKVENYIVQTESMRELLGRKLARCVLVDGPPNVNVVPVVPRAILERPSPLARGCLYDFVYVAAGVAHKNHKRLIQAWKLLGQRGHFPTLAFTIGDEAPVDLIGSINNATQAGIQIVNLGEKSHGEILDIYAQSEALIFPSEVESFGLPLLEAARLGLPILASELDFVRDVVKPSETFDPHSALSIARAVERHKGWDDQAEIRGWCAGALIDTVLNS